MQSILNNLNAMSYQTYKVLSIVFVAVAAVCALFILIVILMQSGNSDGTSALNGGSSDTFYGKNKSKTLEHKLKVLTGICIAIIAVLMVGYFVLELIHVAV